MDDIIQQVDEITGEVLQKAIDESDGSYKRIKDKLLEYKEYAFEVDQFAVVKIVDEALQVLEWSLRDYKPFE